MNPLKVIQPLVAILPVKVWDILVALVSRTKPIKSDFWMCFVAAGWSLAMLQECTMNNIQIDKGARWKAVKWVFI